MADPRNPLHQRQPNHSKALGLCSLATLVIMVVLVFVTWAVGQEAHPFPFKTLQEIETGIPAWVLEGTGPPSSCPGAFTLIVKREYYSGARSVWTVYTDGILFAAGYFTPGADAPIVITTGHITSESRVVVDTQTPFNGSQRPCDPWFQKTT